jgi:tetratricopeptide (TPR) repeat protein
VEEAIACYKKAIEIDPKLAPAHYNLGNALLARGKAEEAIASFQKALEIDPKYAEAHCNLGDILRSQGRFTESLAAYRRGHELGTKRPGWPYPSAEWVRRAETMAALEGKLPAFLKGQFQPRGTAELLGLAGVCRAKKLYAAAARLDAEAFAADPKLAGDLITGHRYNAACDAAQAARGDGVDAPADPAGRAALRGKALAWLRADLAHHMRQGASVDAPTRQFAAARLTHWLADTDLSGLRDTKALENLPADERQQWRQFWTEVKAALALARKPLPPPERLPPPQVALR